MWFEFEVSPTFVPAELLGTDDQRQLGIGVGALEWLVEMPPDGIGFYDWEQGSDGVPFRWTGMNASFLKQEKHALGAEARQRIESEYTLKGMTQAYLSLYNQMAPQHA